MIKDNENGDEIFIQPQDPDLQGEPQGSVEFGDKVETKIPEDRKFTKTSSGKEKNDRSSKERSIEAPLSERPDLDMVYNPPGTLH